MEKTGDRIQKTEVEEGIGASGYSATGGFHHGRTCGCDCGFDFGLLRP